jgi:hypothetical protein
MTLCFYFQEIVVPTSTGSSFWITVYYLGLLWRDPSGGIAVTAYVPTSTACV